MRPWMSVSILTPSEELDSQRTLKFLCDLSDTYYAFDEVLILIPVPHEEVHEPERARARGDVRAEGEGEGRGRGRGRRGGGVGAGELRREGVSALRTGI